MLSSYVVNRRAILYFEYLVGNEVYRSIPKTNSIFNLKFAVMPMFNELGPNGPSMKLPAIFLCIVCRRVYLAIYRRDFGAGSEKEK